MPLPIIEEPLYGKIKIETSPWATPFVWTDRTADLVQGINYSVGGRVGQPGSSPVDAGTLNATFADLSSVPNVGALVRISFTGVAGYAFVGYIQDVSQRIVFNDSVSYTTPITLTTINCVDWVAYIGQFQLVGIGGADPTTGAARTTSAYAWTDRVAALNKSVDATFATKLITAVSTSLGIQMGDSDMVGSIADHLDLISRTTQTYWYGMNVLPTDTTTGRDGLITMRSNASTVSSGKTFTDVLGTAGQLHYTEIDFENSSQNVANEIVVNNQARFHVPAVDVEVTKLGGFNEENFVIVDGAQVIGVNNLFTETATDSSSITTYGKRQIELATNGYISPAQVTINTQNLIANPSAEYSDDGFSGIANSRVRRRKPLQDTNPFTAYHGEWAIRMRISTATASCRAVYTGGESDGIPVVAGTQYFMSAWAARGTVSSTNARAFARIRFFDEDEGVISDSDGANVNLTTANTWYDVRHSITAPANAVRARVELIYNRSSGANFAAGERYWADAFQLSKSTIQGYFDGDSAWGANYGYLWTGGVGASPSYRIYNILDDIATNNLALYSTTSNRPTRIRWNAQEDITAVPSIYVGSTIQLVYKGTTTTQRVVGIDGNISPDRYMIDYYLTKV